MFQNIPTLKEITVLKQDENRMITDMIARTQPEEAVIEIKKRVGKTQEVQLNGNTHIIEESDTGVLITDNGE